MSYSILCSLLQDANLTWYTDNPKLTPCFESTILVWIPCGLLWLLAPFETHVLLSSHDRLIPWSWLNVSKIVRILLQLPVFRPVRTLIMNGIWILHSSLFFRGWLWGQEFTVVMKEEKMEDSISCRMCHIHIHSSFQPIKNQSLRITLQSHLKF